MPLFDVYSIGWRKNYLGSISGVQSYHARPPRLSAHLLITDSLVLSAFLAISLGHSPGILPPLFNIQPPQQRRRQHDQDCQEDKGWSYSARLIHDSAHKRRSKGTASFIRHRVQCKER